MFNEFLNTIILGIGIGITPSMLWLLFWLREDIHPEPFFALFRTFIFGALCVPVAIVLQYGVLWFFGYPSPNTSILEYVGSQLFTIIILWALIEESLKLFVSAETALFRKEDDEPMDPTIYLITAALGFAAVENVLFVLSPLFDGNIIQVIVATNMRFVGATLLHIVASGSIGIALGFVFYKSKKVRIFTALLSLCGAVALHAGFNLLIIKAETYMLIGFALVWILVIGLILAIEKIKLIKKP